MDGIAVAAADCTYMATSFAAAAAAEQEEAHRSKRRARAIQVAINNAWLIMMAIITS